MGQHEEVTLVFVPQVLVVAAHFAIVGLAVFAAIATAISMWLNKQEIEGPECGSCGRAFHVRRNVNKKPRLRRGFCLIGL